MGLESGFSYHPKGCFVAGQDAFRSAVDHLKEKGLFEIIRPVVYRYEGKVSISFPTSGGPCGIEEEDWTLPLSASKREDGTYDVCVGDNFFHPINVKDRNSAIEEMKKYIGSGGRFVSGS